MTCFWDGIISSLKMDDLKILGLEQRPSPKLLAYSLKKNNRKTNSITWENMKLSENQLAENHIHISDYISESVNKGYLCSICDPFLCLLCELLECNITHFYLNNPMRYKYPGSIRTIEFKSDRGHFWKK